MSVLSAKRRDLYALFALVFALAAGVIWIRTATVKDTYLYVQREKEYRRLEQEIQGVRVRWLKLTAPKRLEALAQSLGLMPPNRNQVLKYEPDHGSAKTTSR
jgi:hypothetical protein